MSHHIPLASEDDDQRLIHRHRAGDPRARPILIERYLPLARTLALRYRDSREPLDDLIQVASVGLIKSVDRWEPERGCTFATFAVPTILGELRRYFRDFTWMVRPPRNLSDLTLLIERSRQPLQVAIGREPAPADFASHLGQRREVVAEALQAAGARTACSLEAEHHGNGEAETIGERFGGDDHGYEHAEARATFESLLCVLDQRAREILRLRFADDLPQSQIAARVGCSQVSISRIIRSSIEKLSAYALAPAG